MIWEDFVILTTQQTAAQLMNTDFCSNTELLQYVADNGIIDLTYVRDQIEMKKKEELLKLHPYKIWEDKGGVWHTYLPDTEKGRVHRKRNSKKEIQDVIIEYWKQRIENPTVEEIYNEWLNGKLDRNEITKSTRDRYNRQFDECFGSIRKRKIKNIEEYEISDFLRSIIYECDLTAKGFSNFRTLVYGIFKRAKEKKYVSYSITQIVQDTEISKKSFRKVQRDESSLVFSEEETEKMYEYFNSISMDIIDLGLLLLFNTGLRPGELAGLKICDISQNTIDIHRTEIRYKGDDNVDVYEVRDFPKTEAGIRTVIVPENSLWILKKIRRLNPFGEFLFEINGKRVLTYQFSQRLETICNRLGFVKKSQNKIRKTYGTILLDQKVDESLIISQMGHTDITTTKKFYYKDRKSLQRKQEIINNVFAM